jgi:hypothetical protein
VLQGALLAAAAEPAGGIVGTFLDVVFGIGMDEMTLRLVATVRLLEEAALGHATEVNDVEIIARVSRFAETAEIMKAYDTVRPLAELRLRDEEIGETTSVDLSAHRVFQGGPNGRF